MPAGISVLTLYIFYSCTNIKNIKISGLMERISSNTLGIYLIHIPIEGWLTS
jgi:surface polysaccharide O-acyltransferase-like enzyme